MNYPEYLILDLDDTLVQTNPWLLEATFKGLEKDGKTALLNELKNEIPFSGSSTLSLKGELRNAVYEYGLKDGRFMLEAEPTFLLDLIFNSDILKHSHIHIGTHRGWFDKGYEYTKEWLKKHGVWDKVNNLSVLDNKTIPNKLEYFTELYGDDFIIIDDNPCHDINKVVPFDKRIRIFDFYGTYPAYVNQERLKIERGKIVF